MQQQDDSGWDADDPEYVVARIRAVADSMVRVWRGQPLDAVEQELRRRLATLGRDWPAELVEHLVRGIADPHWHWKHPLQALGLGRRFHARVRAMPLEPTDP
ncbi:MAG: hypothetical protein M3211_05285 [Actinomycetota bacterium]|nr:hypothetical protein [Actinomycetota bacterium]